MPPVGFRDELEVQSSQFDIKYLLAVMNSTFAKSWLVKRCRSKIHVYPEDWKSLPIVRIGIQQQMELVRLVDAIFAEFELHGYSLPSAGAKRVQSLEQEIDARVARLYGLTEAEVAVVAGARTGGAEEGGDAAST